MVFTKPIAMALSATLVLSWVSYAGAREQLGPASLPNLLVILSDDQGRWALGDYDSRIETPNISYLAARGVRFDHAIAPTPVCSAARASFYTGRMPSQHGVHDFLSETDSDANAWLEDEVLISELLSERGYRVGLFGKWHATTEGWRPARGFDRWLSYDERNATWQNQYLHSGEVFFSDDGDAISHTGVQADFITDRTADFIREDSSEPFAIFVNYVEPHFPFAGLPDRLVSRYRPVAERMVPIGDYSGWSPASATNYTAKEQSEMMAHYLAAVTLLDEQVGRLLDTLEATGKLETTLVVYSSDHGHMTGQYGLYGKGNATRPQNLYDYSLAIPLVVAGPKELVERGQVRNEFVSLLDLFPTLLELSGSAHPGDAYDGPGRSLVNLLKGERPLAFREWHFAEYGNARMISDERWKLVRYYRNAEEFDDYWYDLTHPVSERQSREPPETLRSHMVERLEAFFDSYELEHRSGRTVLDQPRHNGMEPWRDRAQSSR